MFPLPPPCGAFPAFPHLLRRTSQRLFGVVVVVEGGGAGRLLRVRVCDALMLVCAISFRQSSLPPRSIMLQGIGLDRRRRVVQSVRVVRGLARQRARVGQRARATVAEKPVVERGGKPGHVNNATSVFPPVQMLLFLCD